MQLSAPNLEIFVGTIFLLVGAIYRYRLKKFSLSVGDGLTLIALSYMAAGGIVFMLKGIDFVFFNSSILLSALDDVKIIVVIGSVAGIFVTYYYFHDFLRRG